DARWRWIRAALDVGAHVAPERRLFGTRIASEAHLAAGVELSPVLRGAAGVAPRALAEGEAWIGPAGDRPVEARLALGARFPVGVTALAGVGFGLDHDIAAPRWRLVALVRIAPRAPGPRQN